MDTNDLPRSRAEAKAVNAKHYFTGEPCLNGHIAPRKTKGACVECIRLETAKYADKRREYFDAYNKSEAGQASKQRYYKVNKELVKLRALARSNEDRRQYRNTWKINNPDLVRADTKHRRDKHKHATPRWLTTEQRNQIRQFYLDAMTTTRVTGVPYVVDHIVPLRGKDVCGLHVPWNLQVITRADNLAKSNNSFV